MKICILTTSFPRYKNDFPGIFIYQIAKNLIEREVEIDVIAPHDSGTKKYEIIDEIKVHRFRYMFSKLERLAYGGGIPANLRKSVIAKLEVPLFFLSFFWATLRTCRTCDVIHANWIPSGLVAVSCKKIYRKPIVLTIHGSDFNEIPEDSLIQKLSIYTLKNVDKIISMNKDFKHKMIQMGINGDKITVSSDGIYVDDFKFKSKESNDFKIVYVGRLVPEKGVEYLITAMKQVIEKIPDVHLTIVGGGPSMEELEIHIKKLTLQNNIKFVGYVTHFKIPEYLREADLFVMSSLREGLPDTLLEAMAAGKAVVATTVGGIPEAVVNGETGILVPPRDSEALAEGIIYLLRNNSERIQMGKNARKRAEELFSWEKITNRIVEIYKDAIRMKHTPSTLAKR